MESPHDFGIPKKLKLSFFPSRSDFFPLESLNFGTIVLDVRTVPPVEGEEFQLSRFSRYLTPICQRGAINVIATASRLNSTIFTAADPPRVSAASANWIARPVDILKPSESTPASLGIFGCCIRRNLPGLFLLPASATLEESIPLRFLLYTTSLAPAHYLLSTRNETESSFDKSSHSIFDFRKKKKSIPHKTPYSESSAAASASSFLEHCLEKSAVGFTCIPWSQVGEAIADGV